jgi:hypothetical protein
MSFAIVLRKYSTFTWLISNILIEGKKEIFQLILVTARRKTTSHHEGLFSWQFTLIA